jgi:hypothetical protein
MVAVVVGFGKLVRDLASCRKSDDAKPPWERDVPL